MKRTHADAFTLPSDSGGAKLVETGVLNPARSSNFVVCFDGEPLCATTTFHNNYLYGQLNE